MTYMRWGEVYTRLQFVPGPQPLSLSRLNRLTQVCKSWRGELEAVGFCGKTAQLCLELAEGGNAAHLVGNVLRRMQASTGDNAERVSCYDIAQFLTDSLRWKGSLQEWLQAASQEPDASFLSRGAASTAQALGLALVQRVVKPQLRYGAHGLIGHEDLVYSVALSRDDKRAARRRETVSVAGGE